MSKTRFKHLPGMPDVLPQEMEYFEAILRESQSVANFYGFLKVETPIVEEAELFIKGTGEATEIVQKQMYTFKTKGGENVALRPEFTPSFVRLFVEHGLEEEPKPVKLWGEGPLFRYERPQKGRLRQFHQFNFEIFGSTHPISEAILIKMFLQILKRLGIEKVNVEINSLGCKECQPYFLKVTKKYFSSHKRALCALCKARIQKNPFRIFDCKEEKCQRISKLAPKITEYLCDECKEHFNQVVFYLKAMKIPHLFSPFLARGLDYYQRTVFEIKPSGSEEKKDALIGGGRYDDLIKKFGGKTEGALGGAGGIERIKNLMEELKIPSSLRKRKIEFEEKAKAFLVQLGQKAKLNAIELLDEFYAKKMKIAFALEKDSLSSQLKLASKLGVKYSLILGEKEASEKKVILRNMETGSQRIIPQTQIIRAVKI